MTKVLQDKSEHIKVEGYRGTWYVIDSTIFQGEKYFLLEHETYGDETEALVVNIYGGVITETWDDIDTALTDEFGF